LLDATSSRARVVVANKADLPPAWVSADVDRRAIDVSALTGEGLGKLREALLRVTVGEDPSRDTPAVTNLRHAEILRRAGDAAGRARHAAAQALSEEFVLADVHEARQRLEEITGRRTADDLLHAIFAKFCIGK
jgi:tRNA modification GTPase